MRPAEYLRALLHDPTLSPILIREAGKCGLNHHAMLYLSCLTLPSQKSKRAFLLDLQKDFLNEGAPNHVADIPTSLLEDLCKKTSKKEVSLKPTMLEGLQDHLVSALLEGLSLTDIQKGIDNFLRECGEMEHPLYSTKIDTSSEQAKRPRRLSGTKKGQGSMRTGSPVVVTANPLFAKHLGRNQLNINRARAVRSANINNITPDKEASGALSKSCTTGEVGSVSQRVHHTGNQHAELCSVVKEHGAVAAADFLRQNYDMSNAEEATQVAVDLACMLVDLRVAESKLQTKLAAQTGHIKILMSELEKKKKSSVSMINSSMTKLKRLSHTGVSSVDDSGEVTSLNTRHQSPAAAMSKRLSIQQRPPRAKRSSTLCDVQRPLATQSAAFWARYGVTASDLEDHSDTSIRFESEEDSGLCMSTFVVSGAAPVRFRMIAMACDVTLVTRLTHLDVDHAAVASVFACAKGFLTARSKRKKKLGTFVMDELLDWFLLGFEPLISPPRMLSLLFLCFFMEESLQIVPQNIMFILKRWMDLRPFDFYPATSPCSLGLNAFFADMETEENEHVCHVVECLMQAHTDIQHNSTQLLATPKFTLDSLAALPPPATPLSLAAVNLDVFAEQLTLIEWDVMRAVRCSEFMKQRWNKANRLVDAPQLCFAIEWFNRMCRFYQFEIMNTSDMSARAHVMCSIISLTTKFFALNNFNGVMECLAALNSAAVWRLKATWALIPTKLSDEFARIDKKFSAKGNFARYREMLLATSPPFVPLAPMLLTDCTFIDDCKTDTEDGMVNFEKMRALGADLIEFYRMADKDYDIRSDAKLQEQILTYPDHDPELFYQISLRLESRQVGEEEASKKKSRRYTYMGRVNIMTSEPAELSERDWRRILAGATERSFGKDEVVLSKGETITAIFRVKQGVVREEGAAGSFQRTFPPESLFGEMAIVSQKTCAEVRYVSAAPDTVVEQMDLSFLVSLFEQEAGLSRRFFKMMAKKLAVQLENMSGGDFLTGLGESQGKLVYRSCSKDMRDAIDTKLCKKFNLKNEVVMGEYSCTHCKRRAEGQLFVMQTAIGFLSRAFGIESKEVIQLSSIVSLSKKGNRLSIVVESHKEAKSVRKTIVFLVDNIDDCMQMVENMRKRVSPLHTLTVYKNPLLQQGSQSSLLASPQAPRATQSSPSCTRQAVTRMVSDGSDANASELSSPVLLSSDDWAFLTEGTKTVEYKQDAVVVSQGGVYQCMYQVLRGSCRIERDGEVLGLLQQGDFFGEMTFLECKAASASVVADSNNTELLTIEGTFVNILFDIKPGFAGRFYNHLCHIITEKMKQKEGSWDEL